MQGVLLHCFANPHLPLAMRSCISMNKGDYTVQCCILGCVCKPCHHYCNVSPPVVIALLLRPLSLHLRVG